MIVFAGLPVIVTDAVFSDHLKVERTGIFCGKAAYATFHAHARCPAMVDLVTEPFCESVRTGRSVQVTIVKPGMAYPVPYR